MRVRGSYGESVINDAVSIVMYRTLSKFLLTPLSFGAVMKACGSFFVMLFGSTVCGCIELCNSCPVISHHPISSLSSQLITSHNSFTSLNSHIIKSLHSTLISSNHFTQLSYHQITSLNSLTSHTHPSQIAGAVIALFSCLVLKYVKFESAVIESVTILLTAYFTFEIIEACELSGITATLACGVTMNYFGLRNLKKSSRDFVQSAVKVASSFSESLIFFQVGENVFLQDSLVDVPWKLVLCVYGVIVAVRVIMIFGFTYFINKKRTRSKISFGSQMMMVHSGLRGAMSYSLALTFPSHNQEEITRYALT